MYSSLPAVWHLLFLTNKKFYRQNSKYNSKCLSRNKELHDRTDALKIHALIHNQLSAPIFQDMLLYAWYASKLIPNRRVFCNVNQVCFPLSALQKNIFHVHAVKYLSCVVHGAKRYYASHASTTSFTRAYVRNLKTKMTSEHIELIKH